MEKQIRTSIGSLIVLGLKHGTIRKNARPTTCYLMTHNSTGCQSRCQFCSQTATKKELSRVQWPVVEFEAILAKLKTKPLFGRFCIQSLIYPEYANHLIEIVHRLRTVTQSPISVAIGPLPRESLEELKDAGVTDVGIGIDTCTPSLFQQIKASPDTGLSWESEFQLLADAQEIFGKNHAKVHVIVGLGETEEEMCKFLHKHYQRGIGVSLFPFFPIQDTPMENHPRVSLESYRKIQLVAHLLRTETISYGDLIFSQGLLKTVVGLSRSALSTIIHSNRIFQTQGCSACNRPYYTSTPGEVQYNFPYPPGEKTLDDIVDLLEPLCQS